MNEKGRKNEERNEIGEALRGLKRVEAPANFEFGVKAKIANGKPSEKSSLSRFVRYAVPATLVLIVGIILVLNSLYLTGERSVADVPPVIETKIAAPQTITEAQTKDESSVPQPMAVDAVNTLVSGPSGKAIPKIRRPVFPKTLRNTTAGSYDAAQKLQEPIFPKNSNTMPAVTTNDVRIKGILGSLGIDASFDGTNWKINSVGKKSIAEQAGIKPGDWASAIDDHLLTDTTVFKKPFTPKTITLIRDGKAVRVELH